LTCAKLAKLMNLPRGALLPVWALGLLAIVVLWTVLLYDVETDRDEALHQAENQTQSIALALREHAHRVIAGANLLLDRLDENYARSSRSYALPEWVAQSQYLEDTLIQVGIVDPHGYLSVTTLPHQERVDLSDREYFRVQRNPGAPQPFISRPLVGRISGRPSIVLSRRIEHADGSFAGVGVASLDPAYFDRFFWSINLGPNSVIELVGRDGVLRARASRAGPTIGIGHDFSGTPIMKALLSAPQGVYRARSDIDGIERIYAFAADDEYPVIVAAGMAVDDILGPLRSTAIVEFAAAAALTAVILWLVYRSTHELSQRVEYERRLRESQKLELIGQLAAGVAHDFGNILTAVKGNAELAGRSKTDGGLHKFLGNVEKAAQQGERIVSNLLAYSRQQRLQPEAIDVNKAVRTVVELSVAGLGARWSVGSELAPQFPPVTADAAQVEMALLNIAINARDAMPAGGVVIFKTRLVEVGEHSEPHDLAPGRYVAISAKDNGIGMPPDVAAKAFDPFFTTKEKGSGLGLSQTYGLARQLGGTVTIDTEQDIGTTITIYFPVMARSPISTDSERPVTDSAAPTFLGTHDDADVRKFIEASKRPRNA
jgi:two-component system, NtrC family, sensor kinase